MSPQNGSRLMELDLGVKSRIYGGFDVLVALGLVPGEGLGMKSEAIRQHDNSRHARYFVPMFAAALVGLTLSGSAWFAALRQEDRLAEQELQERAKGLALLLQHGVDEYLDQIAALRALFQSSNRGILAGLASDRECQRRK